MLLNKEKAPAINYKEDWPTHYYDIEDIDTREKILTEMLEANAGDRNDRRRLELLRKRYPANERTGAKRKDAFVAAWMGLLIDGRLGTNFLNRKKRERDIRQYFTTLCVLDEEVDAILLEEWRQFARFWIESCAGDRSYDSTAFGLFRLGDERLGKKIAAEIYEVTSTIPARFGLEEELRAFRRVMKESYIAMVDQGERYWADVTGERD